MITPDPRLVAAMANALDHAGLVWSPEGRRYYALAILPAFLADPRTHEWLEERLVVEGHPEGWILRAFVASILGREP